jgi:hypothetical protein
MAYREEMKQYVDCAVCGHRFKARDGAPGVPIDGTLGEEYMCPREACGDRRFYADADLTAEPPTPPTPPTLGPAPAPTAPPPEPPASTSVPS